MFKYFLFTGISILFSAFTAFYFFKFLKFIIYQLYDESSTLVTLMKESNRNFRKDIKSLKTSVKKLKRKVARKNQPIIEIYENDDLNFNNDNLNSSDINNNNEYDEQTIQLENDKNLLNSFSNALDILSTNPLSKDSKDPTGKIFSSMLKNIVPMLDYSNSKDKILADIMSNADFSNPNFYKQLSDLCKDAACKNEFLSKHTAFEEKKEDELSSDESWNDVSKEN
jgi:hypothetical protein